MDNSVLPLAGSVTVRVVITHHAEHRRPNLPFHKALRLSLCHAYHKLWTPGRDCAERKAFRCARDSLCSGESRIHFVQELPDSLQQTDSLVFEDDVEGAEGHMEETHFAGAPEKELLEALADPDEEEVHETKLAKEWDEEFTTHVISARLS